MLHVHAKPLHQPLDGRGAQVGAGLFAIQEVIQSPLAQGPLCNLHFVDVQQIKHGTQHADTTPDDCSALLLEPVQAETVGTLGAEQTLSQPVQSIAGDQARRSSSGGQNVTHGARCARRPIGNVPCIGAKGRERLVQHCLGRNLCPQKGLGGELSIGKIALRPGHAAHPERGHRVGRELFAKDEFGGSSSDVHDQASLVGLGQQSRHALVDQSGLFGAGNHINRISQHLTAA